MVRTVHRAKKEVTCDGIDYTMKEMVGGCCVCSDERGWPDNPLVYCDGNGCTVAVHQACYGIVTVPLGPWFCRKCESPDRQAKVRCELCPSRSGALKQVDTGGWAHVVCALYIPEVRFGNVTSMEPIILQFIPPERYNKTCYICQDEGRVHRASIGACMQCNKSGCKQQFHVTCAQSWGFLCEEAGNYLDNVKYCGYCRHHYSKVKKGGNVKTIPPYKPISQDSHSSDSSPEKEGDANRGVSPILVFSSSKSLNKSNTGRKMPHQSLKITLSNIALISTSTTSSTTKVMSSESAASTSKGIAISEKEKKTLTMTSSTSSAPSNFESRDILSSSFNLPSSSTSLSGLCRTEPSSSETSEPSKNIIVTSKSKLQKGTSNKSSSISKSTPVITNAPTSNITGSVISTTSTSQQAEQTFKEKMEDPITDIKQTKKKKALTQSTPQDLSLHGNETTVTSSAAGAKDRPYTGNRTPDSTNNEKTKKPKTDISSENIKPLNQTQNFSSGNSAFLNPPQATHTTYGAMTESEPKLSPHTVDSLSQVSSNSNSQTSISSKISDNQSSQAENHSNSSSSSLIVSVPLLQSNQGLNLSAHQDAPVDLVSSQCLSPSQPSCSSWGLKVAYEPQTPNITQNNKMPHDTDVHYSLHKRPRTEIIDITGKTNFKQQGALAIENDKMSNIAKTGIKNKKRNTLTLVPPGVLHVSQGLPSIPTKRLRQTTPPPSTSLQESHLSPPTSPIITFRRPEYQRYGRAPHMLGNELNPESAAAARLSEQLSAELAAHSVYRAPSPLVPPPLMNRVTNSGRVSSVNLGGSIGLTSSGAQSLDQLLERQWEQGSQFLMEQAQNFDIASLLSCLHQLKSENINLEEHVGSLTERRDHLLAVNARLTLPLHSGSNQGSLEQINKISRDTTGLVRQSTLSSNQHQRPDIMGMERAQNSGRSGSGNIGNSGPQNLEHFVERQWEQGAQYSMDQTQNFDRSSQGTLEQSNKLGRDTPLVRQSAPPPPPSQHQRPDIAGMERTQQIIMRDTQIPKSS